jgi:hypothetical protein
MGRPRWQHAWWQCRVGSLMRSLAYLPFGFILLQIIGCAFPGSSPALKKDTRSLQSRPKAGVDRTVLPPLPAKPPPMGGSGG